MVASHARADRRFTGRGFASVPTADTLSSLPVVSSSVSSIACGACSARSTTDRPSTLTSRGPPHCAHEFANDPRAAQPGRAAPQGRPAATEGLRRPPPTPPCHEPRGLGWPSSPKGSRTRGSAKPSRLVATVSSRYSLTPRPSQGRSPTPGATPPARPSSTHTSTAGAVASLLDGTARIASWRVARCRITGSPSVERLEPADAPWCPGRLPSACGANAAAHLTGRRGRFHKPRVNPR